MDFDKRKCQDNMLKTFNAKVNLYVLIKFITNKL